LLGSLSIITSNKLFKVTERNIYSTKFLQKKLFVSNVEKEVGSIILYFNY